MQLGVSILISATCLITLFRNAWIAIMLYRDPDDSSRAACFHYTMKATINMWLIALVLVSTTIPDYMWAALLLIKLLDFVALEIFFWDIQKVDID